MATGEVDENVAGVAEKLLDLGAERIENGRVRPGRQFHHLAGGAVGDDETIDRGADLVERSVEKAVIERFDLALDLAPRFVALGDVIGDGFGQAEAGGLRV